MINSQQRVGEYKLGPRRLHSNRGQSWSTCYTLPLLSTKESEYQGKLVCWGAYEGRSLFLHFRAETNDNKFLTSVVIGLPEFLQPIDPYEKILPSILSLWFPVVATIMYDVNVKYCCPVERNLNLALI